MQSKILKLIESYQTIIIHRHHHPDGDAIGSQVGLAETLKINFPKKSIYIVGDKVPSQPQIKMDVISDDIYQGALAIILDTAVSHMVSDHRYKTADKVIIMDHHANQTNIDVAYFYHQPNFTSTCEILVDLFEQWHFKISEKGASYLYAGLVSDSGRFLYINAENGKALFKRAAYLLAFKPDIKGVYEKLYTEPLVKRKASMLFSHFELTKNNVAYRKSIYDTWRKSGIDFQALSRGMVNNMAGIKEVLIWAGFTENEEGDIIAEIRSRGIVVVDIAKKYGGGGHAHACGATLKNWQQVDQIIEDLDERAILNHDIKTNI